MKKLSFMLLGIVLFMASCTEEEEALVDNVVSGEITTPTTWLAGKVYVVDGGVSVLSDLVIEPGAIIKFNQNSSLSVGSGAYGSLMAVGTIENPIVFTSNANIPSAGDWRGLEFWENNSKSSTLAFCTIEYAGASEGYGAAVYLYATEISMVSCNISKSETYGVYNQDGSFKSFDLNNISECDDYPIAAPVWTIHTISSLNILSGKGVYVNNNSLTDADVTWNLLTVPYVLDWIEINENATLTIEPGCTLKFTAGGSISVGAGSYGKLVAEGTALLPITFTSSANSPSSGDWRGIEMWEKTSNGTVFNFCVVHYAGSSAGYGANLYVYDNGSNVTIKNSEIGFSDGCGIATPYSTPTIENIVYVNNADDLCNE